MVLDVMLPDMEGFEVARRLGAQRAEIPIIFLTARDATEDKVRGLTLGGDDYVTKPFSLEELVARIRTILRRTGQPSADSSRLVFEDLELDEDAHEVARARRPDRPHRDRVPAPALPDAQPAPRPHPRADARPCLELRLRRRRARAGDLRELPAQEARRPRPAADPDGARRRLRAARAARRDGVPARPPDRRCCSSSRPRRLLLLAGITYAEQRSFLLDRVDQQARSARRRPPLGAASLTGERPRAASRRRAGGGGGGGRAANLPPGTYGELRDAIGQPVLAPVVPLLRRDRRRRRPTCRRDLPVDELRHRGREGRSTCATASWPPRPRSVGHDRRGRRPADRGRRRRWTGCAGRGAGHRAPCWSRSAWWPRCVVRLGLRPLDRMADDRRAIAAGDLSRRVEPGHARRPRSAASASR